MNRFSETLLEHARRPLNFGRDADANLIGVADFAEQPAIMEIFLRLCDGKVTHATFYAAGCGVTMAIGSVVTDMIKGWSIDECRKINASCVVSRLDGVPPDKFHCVDVAIAALNEACTRGM